MHFKNERGIDISVDSQNTFWSIVAGLLKTFLNTPLWFGRLFSRFILAAAGGFELDTLDAALQLDANCVNFNNVRYENDKEWQERSVLQKIYNFEYQPLKAIYHFFGGSPHHDADYVLTHSAALYKGMKSRAVKMNETTASYFAALLISNKTARQKEYTWTEKRNGYKLDNDISHPSLRKKCIGFFVNPFKKSFANHQCTKRSDDVS